MKPFIRPFGLFCILVSLVTWGMDLTEIVVHCQYCRIQRTAIGILGVLVLIRKEHVVIEYLAIVIGFFAADVASRQLMDNYVRELFDRMNIYMASGALMLILAEVYVILNVRRFSQ